MIVTDNLTIDGGSARVALSSARALAAGGIPVTVVAGAGTPGDDVTATPNLRVVSTGQGVALESGNKAGGAVRGLWNSKAYRLMNAVLAELDPATTIVHAHGWTKALSSSVLASAVRSRFPLVVTLHEYFTACPTGCLYHHGDHRVCELKPMSAACILSNCDSRSYAFKLYRVARQIVARNAASIPGGVTAFITVSAFSRSVIEPFLPAGSRYYAVANPVEVQHRLRAPAESHRDFVFVGRLSAEKGGALFADAAAAAGVKAVFIGDGPDRETLAAAYPNAEFAGWLPAEAVTERVRAARCLVMPSLWYETLGLVVLEAAAHGVPAIVPRRTAAYDLIDPGQTGLAFERGDGAGLAAQLRAAHDDELIGNLSRAAYDRYWAKPPTLASHLEQLTAAYGDILSRRVAVGRTAA